MRIIYLAIVILFALAIIVFAVQNFTSSDYWLSRHRRQRAALAVSRCQLCPGRFDGREPFCLAAAIV